MPRRRECAPKSWPGPHFHQLPLRPNGYINISWLPQWLVTDTLMSRPRAAGRAPREKTEFKRLKHSTSLPAPQVGELKASSLARVSGDSHFSGIDPWVFHLPGTLQGAAGVRSVQDESGRPRRGQVQGIWMQGVLLVRGGRSGHGALVCEFYRSLEPQGGGRRRKLQAMHGPMWLESNRRYRGQSIQKQSAFQAQAPHSASPLQLSILPASDPSMPTLGAHSLRGLLSPSLPNSDL